MGDENFPLMATKGQIWRQTAISGLASLTDARPNIRKSLIIKL